MGSEIELKLELSPADIDRVTAATGQEPRTARLISVYFDTPDQALRKAGWSLRVRHDGGRRIQTVKADAEGSVGLFNRSEWEFDIDGDVPDPSKDCGIGKKLLRRVAPVFRTEVTRTTTIVQANDATIELVIDRGDIVAENRTAPLCEVELELKAGGAAGLFALARQLDDSGASIRLGVLTKSERGYQLLANVAAPIKAEAIAVDPGMSSVAAFRTIVWSCIRHFRLNETLLSVSSDADALHQARVALRRLRSAFSLFKAAAADDKAEHLRIELRWLAAILGEARNVDVMLEHTHDAGLLKHLEDARIATYDAVRVALDSSRARRLMLDLAEWLTLGVPALRGETQVLGFANKRLERLRHRLKHDGAEFADLDDHHRHELRIKAKKLRYATEFFASLYDGRKATRLQKRFRSALEEFQDLLGELNDQVTRSEVLIRLGLTEAPAAQENAHDRSVLIDRAVSAYASLLNAKRFWT